jgi:hypothetical protein
MNIYCCKYYRALPHSIILVKLQRGIMTAASSNKWPTNVVPYVLENAFTSADRAIIAAVSISRRSLHSSMRSRLLKVNVRLPYYHYCGLRIAVLHVAVPHQYPFPMLIK